MSDIKRFLTAAIGILILIPVCIFYDYGIWAVMMTVMCAVSTYEIMHCIGLHRKVHFAVPFYVFSLLPVVT